MVGLIISECNNLRIIKSLSILTKKKNNAEQVILQNLKTEKIGKVS